MEIACFSVVALLKEKYCKQYGEYLSHDIWLTPDKIIIRLPQTKTIHIDLVETIALDILGIGIWEFDYWLGQNHIC